MKIGREYNIVTLNDIQPGMVILRRDGHLCVLSADKSIFSREKGWVYFDDYDCKTLECNTSDFDVMKVFYSSQKFDFEYIKRNNKLKECIDISLLRLIWKRA